MSGFEGVRIGARSVFKVLALALIVCLPVLFPRRAAAQARLSLTAEAGLDGACKFDSWLPVRISIENNGNNLDGRVFARQKAALDPWEFNAPLTIPSVSRKALTLYVFPQGRPDSIEVGFRTGGEEIALIEVPVQCVPRTAVLYGVWAANPSAFQAQTGVVSGSGRPVFVQLDETSIPEHPQGLSMLSALTLSGVDTGKLTPAQRSAILVWVTNGGRLLVAGGPDWQTTSAGMADLLALSPSGTTSLASLQALQAYSTGDVLEGGAIVATGDIAQGAHILIEQDGIPLVIERRLGFGSLTYLAADPALEPLRTWAGMENLYRALLGGSLGEPGWTDGFRGWDDAIEALNAVPGLGMPSAFLICGFILLYILAAGPANFIVLRLVKKRDLSWITIPVLVVLFSAIMLLISSSLVGNRPVVNRLAIVEVWPGNDRALVHGLVGVFSPKRDTFTLTMEDGFIAHPVPQQGLSSGRRQRVMTQTGNGFTVENLRVDVGGLESFAFSGIVDALEFHYSLALDQSSGTTPRVTGTVTNTSKIDLQDAILLTPSGAFRAGDLKTGDASTISWTLSGGATASGRDETLLDVFGTNYMSPSRAVNIEELRRFDLLSAALWGQAGSRGNGFFLLGWTNEALFETRLRGGLPQFADTHLIVVHLVPQVTYGGSPGDLVTVHPSQFTWVPYGEPTGGNNPSAYDGSISSGEYALTFSPLGGLDFRAVEALTLHLVSPAQTGAVELKISLWDFESGSWSLLSGLIWGDNLIDDPGQFVGPGGEIRLQVAAAGEAWVSIERSDFTLAVRR